MSSSFHFINGLKNNLKGKGDEEGKDYNDFIFQLAKKIMPQMIVLHFKIVSEDAKRE